jgi:predicted RNase H-like nuclease (RuvC/YqgF family)
LNYADFLKDSANKDKIKQDNNDLNKSNNINDNITIEDYKNENKKLKEQINNLQTEINRLNQENKKQNDYINQINILKNQLKEKDKEINDLKNKVSKGNINQYVNYNDIMVVHFISGDGKIDQGIKCLPTETFAEVEEKLYKIYDEYRETNNMFLAKGNIIKRFKKISENNIKDGDKIQLQNFNE